jgi:hypothetical protein
VKQKENIFEELNKMRNLIHTKAGTVISEQENPIVKDLYNSVAGPGTNPEKFRNSIIQIKNAQEFSSINSELQKFRNSRLDIAGWINDDFDNTNLDDVKKISDHLKSIGINNSYEVYPGTGGFKQNTFKISAAPAAAGVDTSKVEEMWKGSKVSCVTTQPGAKAVKTKNAGLAYLVGQIYYYANGRKMLADGTMANYNCSTEFKSRATSNAGGRANVVSSYSKQLQTSLGVTPTGQLSDVEIDLILKRLEGGETGGATPSLDTQSIPMDANGQPDIDKIIASL